MCQNMTLPASSAFPPQSSLRQFVQDRSGQLSSAPRLVMGAPSAMPGSTGPSYYSPKHLLCTRLPFNSVSLLHHNPHITTKSLPPPLSHHHITTTNTTSPWYWPESVLLFHGNLWQLGNLTIIQLQTGEFASDLIFNTQEFNTLLFRCSE